MWKTFARTTACLAVSATALVAVIRMDASAARPRPTEPDNTEPKTGPGRTRKSAPPKPAPVPAPKVTVASLETAAAAPAAAAATTAPTALVTTPKSEGAGAVTLPDWKGKRLSVVRREARKLGLRVTAKDGIGDTIAADEASSWRVHKQLTDAGSEVEPGTTVQVRVNMITDAAMGY